MDYMKWLLLMLVDYFLFVVDEISWNSVVKIFIYVNVVIFVWGFRWWGYFWFNEFKYNLKVEKVMKLCLKDKDY